MHKIEQLPAILERATSNTMVIFDVDEVLVYPTNLIQLQIASNFWEATMTDFEKRLGKPKRDLLHSIMLLQSHWKLTDTKLPNMIRKLQERNIPVLALTSFRRGELGDIKSIENWRKSHLKKHNIDFSINTGILQKHFEIASQNLSDATKKPVYQDGIIYTDLHSKGDVLNSFLKQTNMSPKEIIFIDDRISNIDDLEILCKNLNIGYIGIHDNRILKKYPSFDENLGRYQFKYLEQKLVWLNDTEAKQKMANPQSNDLEISGAENIN